LLQLNPSGGFASDRRSRVHRSGFKERQKMTIYQMAQISAHSAPVGYVISSISIMLVALTICFVLLMRKRK
jgi:hypothetical protein